MKPSREISTIDHEKNARDLWAAAEEVRSYRGIEEGPAYDEAVSELATLIDSMREDYAP